MDESTVNSWGAYIYIGKWTTVLSHYIEEDSCHGNANVCACRSILQSSESSKSLRDGLKCRSRTFTVAQCGRLSF